LLVNFALVPVADAAAELEGDDAVGPGGGVLLELFLVEGLAVDLVDHLGGGDLVEGNALPVLQLFFVEFGGVFGQPLLELDLGVLLAIDEDEPVDDRRVHFDPRFRNFFGYRLLLPSARTRNHEVVLFGGSFLPISLGELLLVVIEVDGDSDASPLLDRDFLVVEFVFVVFPPDFELGRGHLLTGDVALVFHGEVGFLYLVELSLLLRGPLAGTLRLPGHELLPLHRHEVVDEDLAFVEPHLDLFFDGLSGGGGRRALQVALAAAVRRSLDVVLAFADNDLGLKVTTTTLVRFIDFDLFVGKILFFDNLLVILEILDAQRRLDGILLVAGFGANLNLLPDKVDVDTLPQFVNRFARG